VKTRSLFGYNTIDEKTNYRKYSPLKAPPQLVTIDTMMMLIVPFQGINCNTTLMNIKQHEKKKQKNNKNEISDIVSKNNYC